MKRPRVPAWVKSSEFRWVTYGVVLAAAINLLIGWIKTWDDNSPIASQLESVRAAAEKEGLEPVADQAVDLKATGQKSHLFVFHVRWPAGKPWPSGQLKSDLIELYAEEEGVLHLAFRFRPTTVVRGPVYFKLVAVRDVDGNGRPEILGAFSPFAADSLEAAPIPVVITWDDASQAFRMFPLTTRPPRVRRLSGFYGRALRPLYLRPVTLRDRENDLAVRGFPVTGFAVAETSLGKPAILESFVVKAKCHFCIQELEVKLATARYQAPPQTSPCWALPGRSQDGILVRAPEREWIVARPSEFLERNRKRFERRFECVA